MKTIQLSNYGVVISPKEVHDIGIAVREGVQAGEAVTLDFKGVKGIYSDAAHDLLKSMRGHKGAIVQMKNAAPMVKSVMMYSSGATIAGGTSAPSKKHSFRLLLLLLLLTLGVGQMWGAWTGNAGICVNGTWYKASSDINTDHWLYSKSAINGTNLGAITSLELGGQYDNYDNSQNDNCSWNSNNGIWITITTNSGTQIDNFKLSCYRAEKSGNNNVWKTTGTTGDCGDGSDWAAYSVDISGYAAGVYKLKVHWFSASGVALPSSGDDVATFTINPVVTFKANGGTGSDYTQRVTYNTSTALTACTFTRTGYGFAGWATSSDGSVEYADGANVSLTAHTDLYAKWTPEETHDVTVYYKCGAMTIANSTTETGVGVTTTRSVSAPGIDDHTFSSWSAGSGVKTNSSTSATPISINSKGSGTYSLTANYTLVPCSLCVGSTATFATPGTKYLMSYDATKDAYYYDMASTPENLYFRFAHGATPTDYSATWNGNYPNVNSVTANGSKLNYCKVDVSKWDNKSSIHFSGLEGSAIRIWYDYQNGQVWITETTYSVAVSSESTSKGTVSAASVTAGKNTAAAIDATPKTGYKFKQWSVTSPATLVSSATTKSNSVKTTNTGGAVQAQFEHRFVLRGSIKADGNPAGGMAGWGASDNSSYASATISDGVMTITANLTKAKTQYKCMIRDLSTNTYKGLSTSADIGSNSPQTLSGSSDFWFTTTCAGTYTFTYNVAANTLKVVFPTSHTITYGVNGTGGTASATVGGETVGTSPGKAEAGSTVRFTATPSSGYQFTKWVDGSSTQLSTNNPYDIASLAADKTVKAVFTPITYNSGVLKKNGGSEDGSYTVTYNATSITPSAPTKTGYHVDGYYAEAGTSTHIATAAGVLQNNKSGYTDATGHWNYAGVKDLYAKWAANTYTTENNIDGNGGSNGKYTATYDATSIAINTAPTRTGYNLTGYHAYGRGANTLANTTGALNASQSENKTGGKTLTNSSRQWIYDGTDATIYADWTPKTYGITLDQEGGASGSTSVTMTYDASTHTAITNPTKTGYTFAGYWTGDNGTGSLVIATDGTLQANVSTYTGAEGIWKKDATCTLYAKWTANPYTVVLDKQTSAEGHGENAGTVGDQTVTFDATPATVSGTMPSAADGYAFMGFYSEEGGNGRCFIDPSGNWVTAAGDTISGGHWVKPAGITLYAYYKKAVITGIALSSGTVLPNGSVTATATIEPTPTPTTIVCWKLLYNNGTEYSPQPTFTPESGSEVSFTAPAASGTYKVQAQLRTGGVCGSGTLLSENETSFIVAGTHNVTIQYKCGDVTVKSSTVVEGVKPLEWSEEITPDEIFGYSFEKWVAGDGVTMTIDGGETTIETGGETTGKATTHAVQIKAIYDGKLIAKYTKKNIIYFKNTLGWSEVYYHDSYWDNGQGGAGNKGQSHINQEMSLVPGTTDIYYWEGTPTSANVAFTNATYENYQAFWSKTFDAKVVYPSNPTCASSGDNNYGYNAGTPMFVPVEQDGQDFNAKDDGKAIYYNKGYWRAYDPTTGESGSTGYTLKIYNKTEDSSRELLQSIPFTNADASGQIFKATAGLNAAGGYGIKVERDNSMLYTHTEGHLRKTGEVVTMSVNPSSYKAIWIKATAAGDYDFIITCNGSGQLCLQATFPAAENDYRVLYTDNATWSNTAHTARTWVHPSRVISAEVGATDTISFFVSKDNLPEYKIQRVSNINETTGAITWADVTSWTSISVAKTGVYNFIFTQPSAGFISPSKTEAYTGNFYIRTDNAGSTKWENYRAEDHKMTYSEYAAKITHTGEEWKDFTHYFMKYVDKDKEYGKYKNVNFTIANDYSPCISDTLVQQAGDVSVTPSYTHVDVNGDLQANANIRFMWNIKNNKLQRAYLAAAQSDGTKFLVLQGQSEKLLAPDGTPLTGDSKEVPGNNHGGGANAIQFTDKENWMYEAEVKAVPGGRVKLYAVFNGSTFYYYGDDDAEFTGTHAIELIGGSGGTQDIRVVYDFKTDRLIAAWVPSDGDINAPQTINADIMLIREHQNAGKQINLTATGSISTDKTVYGVMRFNRWTLNNKSTTNTGTTESPVHAVLPVGEQKSQYERFNYMISFPFDVKVGEIFGFGTIGRHYRIYYYDGLGRAKEGFFAERGDDNWRMIDDTDSILHANQGYLLQLNYIRMADDNTATWPQKNMNEVELYFPAMNEINTIKLEDVVIPALGDAYKCKINLQPTYHALNNPDSVEADRRIKDSYWRCIGVPGFTSREANDTWENFNWNADTKNMPYLYEWHMDDNKLSVVSSSTFTFKPMHAYLIQNGNSFTWESVAHPTVAAPRRSAAEEGFYEFYLEMQNGEQALDHTYVRLTDKENITADFDFGQDLSKELNSGANIFTKVGYERLAANNLPLSEQTTIVPVGVKIAAEGNYTFAMPEGTHGVGVTLVDNETGDRTNLSLFDYSVNLTKGDYANRFILEISPVKQMPTDIENVQGGDVQGAKARKVMVDGILYIVKDGKVFDARGAKVK